MRLLPALALVLALSGAYSGSAAAADACSSCGGSGEVPCPAHRAPVAFEIRHSSFLNYACCLGTGMRLCTKCRSSAAAAKFEKRRSALQEWAAERRQNVDAALFAGEPGLSRLAESGTIRHAETENFRLIATADSQPVMLEDVPEGLFKGLPSKSESKRVFAPEHWDWIVLKRFEEEFQAYQEVFRKEGRFKSAASTQIEDACKVAEGKYDVFIWKEVPAHLVCGRKFFGVSNELGTYKHGIRMTVAIGSELCGGTRISSAESTG